MSSLFAPRMDAQSARDAALRGIFHLRGIEARSCASKSHTTGFAVSFAEQSSLSRGALHLVHEGSTGRFIISVAWEMTSTAGGKGDMRRGGDTEDWDATKDRRTEDIVTGIRAVTILCGGRPP